MRTHLPRRHGAVSTLLAAAIVMGTIGAAAADEPPKLVVVLVVDQMRADYIDKFQHQWTAGLHRLVTEGAWFRLAAYPYLNTWTCAAHATIATGSFPASHGVTQNNWWDRDASRLAACTDDAGVSSIGYGTPVEGGHSSRHLALPTLGDELRAQLTSASRVVTLSVKVTSAIMLAGRRADAVVWLDGRSGTWTTSTSYAKVPVPFVQQFTTANPLERDLGKTWTRMLPDDDYLYVDAGIGEQPIVGWSTTFPHPLQDEFDAQADEPDAAFYARWQRSPFADEYLGRMASAAVDALALGRGPGIDFLGVSFSALDRAGHNFGPRSHEVQDLLVRLDATIGTLLAELDRFVGPENYVVAFTADHGVAPLPERSADVGLDAGRLTTGELVQRVDDALVGLLGPGPLVASVQYSDLYFMPGVYEKLVADPKAMLAAIDALRAVPGVWRVLRSDELEARRPTDDPVARAVGLSHYPGRSGDLIVVPKPYWVLGNAATMHGTLHEYDRRVPIIFFGKGIKPGEYFQPATPADIAPTLAFLSGITLAQPDGRVLTEVLAADTQPSR